MSEKISILPLPVQDIKSLIRSRLAKDRSESELRKWFDPLYLKKGTKKKELLVYFPHPFFQDLFQKRLQNQFERVVTDQFGSDIAVTYNQSEFKPKNEIKTSDHAGPNSQNNNYLFDNFLTNKKNFFPFASAKETIAKPGTKYNPLIISGASGTGKTHLLRAITQDYLRFWPTQKTLYFSVEGLNTHYQRLGQGLARDSLSQARLIVIDDLHALQGYKYLQSELLLLFDLFYENSNQMAFACRGKLLEYDFWDPTLLSRLELGLVVHLKPPDLEIRGRFLEKYNSHYNLGLKSRHILFLAQQFNNFSSLSGVITKLAAYKELISEHIDDKALFQIIGNLDSNKANPASPQCILHAVTGHFGYTPSDLCGPRRQQRLVLARQIAMSLCRSELGLSYPQIGRLFGGRNHTTIMHAIKKIEKLKKDRFDVHNLIMRLKKQCHHLDIQED